MAKRKRVRLPKPRDPWDYAARSVRLGDERLRFRRVGDGRDLGDVLTSVRWDDVGMEVTGQFDAQGPLRDLQIRDGDRIRCEFAPSVDAGFRRLWTLEVSTGDGDTLDRTVEDETTTGVLVSTLERRRGTRMDFSYRENKAHPKGWTCDQIARDVGRRAGIPLGKIAKGKHRIKNLVRRNADPVDVILLAYRQEREATNRRFFASWDGKLNMTRLVRSKTLVELMPVIASATLSEQRRPGFATVLDVRVAAKRGKRRTRKIRVRVTSNVKRYGRIAKSVSPKGVSSEAEARKWARESLARRQTPKRELTVTVPLMPLLRRGHALRLEYPEVGIRQVVFVRALSHSWTPSGGTTQITVRFDDPFEDAKAKRNAAAKRDKAKLRGRKVPVGAASAPPQPRNAARRGAK